MLTNKIADCPGQQLRNRLALTPGEAAVAVHGGQIGRQMECEEDQGGCLVQGVVGAVAKVQACRVEAAGAPTDEILNGEKPFGWSCHDESIQPVDGTNAATISGGDTQE